MSVQADNIDTVVSILKAECSQWPVPSVSVIAEDFHSPFHVLVSCIISLRTRDAVTSAASMRLFERAGDIEEMAAMDVEEISTLIFPAGFYRTKAATIHHICHTILEKHNGIVPDTVEQLITIKGIGRKTANLVVTLGYGRPGICVDTHVHRIVNRWGYVKCKTADQTELALRINLPVQYWIELNDLLVAFGQNICKPVSPLCSGCRLTMYCDKAGVIKSR